MPSAATPNEDPNRRPGDRGSAGVDSESSWDPKVDGSGGSEASDGTSSSLSDDESSDVDFMREASESSDIYDKYQRRAAERIYRDYHKFHGKKIPVAKGSKPGANATKKGKGKAEAGGGGNKPKSPQKKARKSHGTIFSGKQSLWKA